MGFGLCCAQSDRCGGRCPPRPLGYFWKEKGKRARACVPRLGSFGLVELELERILAVLKGAEEIGDVGVIDGFA